MDIKFITIHAMHNPGSVFQAYALQEFLRQKHQVQIIDYRPLYFYSEGSQLKLLLKKILWGKAYRNRNEKFIGFVEKNMLLTSKYETFDELQNANLIADIFMTGSDQLWNADYPCGNDAAFYLSFVKRGKKMAYSTSVGKKNIDERNLEILKNKLMDFSEISVREKSTAEQLQNVLGKKVFWVCDPVFLLQSKEYLRFISTKSPIDKPYAVVYLSAASEQLDKVVEYYKSKGLFVVLAGGFTKRCNCDLHIKDVGPEDFLSLIYHSDVVVSSSFHATAFCHIFHKNFVTFLPIKNGERIASLLTQTALQNRGISLSSGTIDFEKISVEIDWQIVDEKLGDYICKSKSFLENAIQYNG